MKLWYLGLISVGLLALTGCGRQGNIDAANEAVPRGSEFTRHLAESYKAHTNYEWYEMRDYKDGNIYARKAIKAADGENVLPDHPKQRDLPKHTEAEINKGHDSLMSRLNSGMRDKMPYETAVAQTNFDCWMEQQEENFQWSEIATCRAMFMMALHEIGGDLPESDFLVHFKSDSDNLDDKATNTLHQAYHQYKDNEDIHFVIVFGHTDTTANTAYNDELSKRRAMNAADFLKKQGVKSDDITYQGFGEEHLFEKTGDNVKNQKNRRAAIYVY